jgi:trehalose/maltose hydrolase-like predicted phosphorylase
MEDIKRAEIAVNAELFNHQYASLSFFYDELEMPPVGFSDEVGWNQMTTGPMELRFSTVLSPDGKPCLAIDFVVVPQPNYSQNY